MFKIKLLKKLSVYASRSSRFGAFAVIICLLTVFCLAPKGVAAAGNLSKSYSYNKSIPAGRLVSLDPKDGSYVEQTTLANKDSLVGVSVDPSGSLLAVDTNKLKVQVALSGVANVTVSNLNGSIKKGDRVAVSPLAGIGMDAGPGMRVIGVAQASFNSSSDSIGSREIHNNNDKEETVKVGFIPVVIDIGSIPQNREGVKLNGYQAFVSNLVNHQVSTLQAILAGAVVLVALLGLIALIFGAVRGSIIAVGRNPLAKSVIFQSTAQVMAMAGLLVIMAIIILYFLLQ